MNKKELKSWLKREVITGDEQVEVNKDYIKIVKKGYKHSVKWAGGNNYENIGLYYLEDLIKLRKYQPVSNIFTKDPVINYLIEKGNSFKLVGGAVIDIYEGREPKDYDFINLSVDKNMDFVDTSDTADTYILNIDGKNYTIQVLKTDVEDFDFTISTCYAENFYFDHKEGRYSTDEKFNLVKTDLPEDRTYKTKILTPCSYKPKNALSSLLRIPHWRKKGYTITDNTYRSLLFAATKVSKERSGEFKKMSQ